MAQINKLYTAKEMALILDVTTDTVWRWGREGKLKTIKVGRTVRFKMPKEGQKYEDETSEYSL